jgi:hypothetical protein
MAGQLTDDRSALTSLATAALLYDAGRARLTRGSGTDGRVVERVLNEDEEERLPNASLVAMMALGKLHPPSVTRSVIVYEALSLRNDATLPYGGGRQPHVLSRILAVARAFTELRVARGASPPLSIDDAIQVLSSQARDNTEKTFVKLLVGTLGVFPAGTLVELSTGELAVVVSTPRLPVDFARPPVRILYAANGALLEEPVDVDLSTARSSEDGSIRFIRKPIDASDQQMKQMRAYVMSLTAKKKRSSDKNRALSPPSEAKPGNEQKPKPDRPLPRRRLSAPQAAIPAEIAALQEAEKQRISVDIIGPADVAPKSADDHEEIAELDASDVVAVERLPPVPRADAAKAARASADPELSFEPIELHGARSQAAPSARVEPSSAPAPQPAPEAKARPARPAVRRWDPRSEDEPPPDEAKAAIAPPPTPKPATEPPASPPRKAVDRPPSMRPTPSVPIPAVIAKPPPPRPGVGKLPPAPKVTTEIVVPAAPPEASIAVPPQRRATGSTRQVSWTEYGKEIVEAVGVPEATQSETDAIHAAYLTDAGGDSSPPEPIEGQGRSAGLRWGGDSSGGHSTGGHSTGGHSTGGHSTGGHSTGGHSTGGHSTGGHSTGGHSTGGHATGGHATGGHAISNHPSTSPAANRGARATNTAGLRWDRSSAGSSAGRDMTASSPGRDVSKDARSSGGVGWDSSQGGRATPVSKQGDDAPSSSGEPVAPSLRGRAKAGSQAWGNPRREKK